MRASTAHGDRIQRAAKLHPPTYLQPTRVLLNSESDAKMEANGRTVPAKFERTTAGRPSRGRHSIGAIFMEVVPAHIPFALELSGDISRSRKSPRQR